jgi:hypothetical protein
MLGSSVIVGAGGFEDVGKESQVDTLAAYLDVGVPLARDLAPRDPDVPRRVVALPSKVAPIFETRRLAEVAA